MKAKQIYLSAMVFGVILLVGCSGGTQSSIDLDRVLKIGASSLHKLQDNTMVNKENAMQEFSNDFANNLNSTQPFVYPAGPLGVKPEVDGSFVGFHDENSNQKMEAGEKAVFKLELDSKNNRLVASDQDAVRDQPFSGMGTGFLAGMLLGNILNRQSATGANPASRKATSRSAYQNQRNARSSARSRAGSGSHSSGK